MIIPLPFESDETLYSAMRLCYVRHYDLNVLCSCVMLSSLSCGHANIDLWEHD